MPRRRIPSTSLPRRPDRRRVRGNTTDAQHRPRRGRPGQLEAIAERRVRALELRKAGGSYREIARQLGCDLHTVHSDVAAELFALRETAVTDATELRVLELERLDAMHAGLSPHIRTGSPPAVSAGVRVSERRARLLGLDAPTASKTEVTVPVVEARQHEWIDGLNLLELEDLEDLQRRWDAVMDDARARIQARRLGLSTPLGTLPPAPVGEAGEVAPTEPTIASAVTAIESPAADSDEPPR